MDTQAAAPAPAGGGERDFFDEATYRHLSKRRRRKRGEQIALVSARLAAMLEPGEQVLYIAPAQESVTLRDYFALGWIAGAYQRGLVVVTDQRLIEILFEYGGKRVGARTRSFPWRAVKEARFRLSELRLRDPDGATYKWHGIARKDRKVLKELVGKVCDRVVALPEVIDSEIWHCPSCSAPIDREDERCASCGIGFRSRRAARALTLAFPGGGMFYLGRTWLGIFMLVGELYLIAALAPVVGALVAEGAIDWALGLGLGGPALVKLEELHATSYFARRRVPVKPSIERRRPSLAVLGALISLFLYAGGVGTAGYVYYSLAFNPGHELHFGPTTEWTIYRDPADWPEWFYETEGARAHIVHTSGLELFVLYQGLSDEKDFEAFVSELTSEHWVGALVEPIAFESVDGVRVTRGGVTEDPQDLQVVYLIYDEEQNAVHEFFSSAVTDGESASLLIDELLAGAVWGEPMPAASTGAVSE